VSTFGLTPEDYWTMATAAVCAAACALPGCFLYLRRMSLLGDALSHAILPGIALAFLFSGSRSIGPMFLGALVAGLVTALLSTGIRRWGRIPEDAALGVVFTTLFAFGVLLISLTARNVDLDPGCVLYGALEFVPFDTVLLLGTEVPRSLIVLTAVLAVNVTLLLVFYKELLLVSFDSALADALGISAAVVTTGLLAVVSGTVVASFEAVGSILVVTLLVAPAATAHLLTDRLPIFLGWAVAAAASSALLGYFGAVYLNTSVAGMVSVVAFIQWGAVALFSPSYGIAASLARRLRFSIQTQEEDILGVLYRAEERSKEQAALTQGEIGAVLRLTASRFVFLAAMIKLRLAKRVAHSGHGRWTLSATGREGAEHVVRGHRLWEAYLDKSLKLPLDHLHEPSDRVEHYLSPSLHQEIAQEVGVEADPHGTAIPPTSRKE
jgi:manganese/zinc/iron transport system permease protein